MIQIDNILYFVFVTQVSDKKDYNLDQKYYNIVFAIVVKYVFYVFYICRKNTCILCILLFTE